MKFDVIYTNNFIEHVMNPITSMQELLLHLNDNGYIIIMSDCFDKYKVEFTHFHLYFIQEIHLIFYVIN